MGTSKAERSKEMWKKKAISSSRENRKMRKRLKEVERSRDRWRKMAERNVEKEKGTETRAEKRPPKVEKQKPKRHWFRLSVVTVMLRGKLGTSVSFRAMSQLFVIFAQGANLRVRKPSHTTVMNWVHKVGYYQLSRAKRKADDWVILLDHSIQLGRDKVFVVYGIRESQIDFTRPLRFQDLSTLLVTSRDKWDGETVKVCLLEVKGQVGKIIYAVGDYGSDLRKGLRLAEIEHIHDISHKIALILEKIYKNDPRYQEFMVKLAKMAKQLGQTEYAYIIPPRQRSKAKFQNISATIRWAMNMLKCLRGRKIRKQVRARLRWIKEYQELIEELSETSAAICAIEKVLKCRGLSRQTVSKCNQITKKLKTDKGRTVGRQVVKHLRDSVRLLPERKITLCSSDILESSFGKYKNYLSNNPMAGTTNLILCIAAFTSSLEEAETKEALETTTMLDIRDWSKKHVGETLLQKRRALIAA